MKAFYVGHVCAAGFASQRGLTGSGKSTTLHALLKRIATTHRLQVVSLEDPIEIHDDAYLQLQINEKNNFTYEQGIRQLLRHDPDVIIRSVRSDFSTAQMVLRCALSGHMVFTLHAKCCSEAIKRLNEFGISNEELLHTLTAVCAQRLYPSLQAEGRVCIYEILELMSCNTTFKKRNCLTRMLPFLTRFKKQSNANGSVKRQHSSTLKIPLDEWEFLAHILPMDIP